MELGDRYEGEFHLGYADGLGMVAHSDGRIYRGSLVLGKRHGCGVDVDLSPYYAALARGLDPEDAWAGAKDAVAASATPGTYDRGFFVSGPTDEPGFCSEAEVAGTVEEVEGVVARARMFQYKPDGAVATAASQDDSGAPAPLMQDPLHYPHGTKFAAPGPLGQCFALPEDEGTLSALDDAAHNTELIWRDFNLPRDIEPESDMAAAVEHAAGVAAERLEEARAAVVLDGAAATLAAARARAEAREAARQRAVSDVALAKRAAARIDDDDLVAAVERPARRGRGGPPSAFGSVTLALGAAFGDLSRALDRATGDARRAVDAALAGGRARASAP
jgi:hypothetical protein